MNDHTTPTDPAWLEVQYNNRARVPEHVQHFERWGQMSREARERQVCLLDVAYGHGPRETLDIFPAKRRDDEPLAPVLVYIHGGYWRSLDKSQHSFLAPAFVNQGACVVMPNYALCPAVRRFPDIARCRWCRRWPGPTGTSRCTAVIPGAFPSWAIRPARSPGGHAARPASGSATPTTCRMTW